MRNIDITKIKADANTAKYVLPASNIEVCQLGRYLHEKQSSSGFGREAWARVIKKIKHGR